MAITLLRYRFPAINCATISLIIFSMATTFLILNYCLRTPQFDWAGDIAVADKFSGDVYHSREVVRMDYAEMEKKFRIYVYPHGDDDDDDDINNSISGKYASEGYFFKNINESAFLTRDPLLAHLFFIPISCHKLHQKVSSYKEMASIAGKYVEGLIVRYPYWNRTLGADHFFLTCHEIDVGATKQVPFLVKNAIRVVCSPSYATGFIPHKDVSLPLVMQPFAKPTGRNDIANRTILGYWAGICNSKTRRKLVNIWGRDDELDIQNSTAYKYNGVRMNKFYRAKFCICPVGSRATSNRITMAIHYGCVPVILADYYDLPFNDILDWRKFSVILNESDVHNLKDILKAKAGAEYRLLYSNLLKVQRHFQWNTPPVKYDTFGMVMYELWLRRHVVKY
ncbi:probable glycosyltransferase at5g20260 [Phtheirospermum japonicum]|uniref:Probable glycosyltransferase at5g20260 n=1 Tax=Phtheirospermum japonicum TaxID=374723 RepID=A0A830BKU9_9LAMI|nr:probable glycosyltransferase at5g20260 [Phtheirospermum japonicum]